MARFTPFSAAVGVCIAFTPALAVPLFAQAQPAGTPNIARSERPKTTEWIHGHVTSIDTADKTITITDRTSPPAMFLVTEASEITIENDVPLSSLQTGQSIEVSTHKIDPNTTSVVAQHINIVDSIRMGGKHDKSPGYHADSVEGTITALSPALTIVTPGNITVTVATTPDVRVAKRSPATFDDITMGAHVQARVRINSSPLFADQVRIQPASGGQHHKHEANALP